jgi:DNA-binding GntR family transcriptional regulator|nr:GntR family transcriptional regulator [uncultured Oscillibacter sp.]
MESKRLELRQQIYTELKEKIISGSFVRNQRLVETQIAAEYGINKANIHDILLMLQKDELVRYEPMKGFYVQGIFREDLLEIAKIREVLENAIFEDFLENAAQDEVEKAKLFTQRKIALLRAGLKAEAHKETLDTFETVYANTSYQRMVNILRMYCEYVDLMILQAFECPEDVSMTIQNSTLLHEVLEKRDIELAKQWTHIRYQNAVNKAKLSRSYRERADRSGE